jgi:hypothetical protein
MNSINYPPDKKKLQDFEKKFYNCLKKDNESSINTHLSNIAYGTGTLDFKTLVTLDFESLINIAPVLKTYNSTQPLKPKTVNGKVIQVTDFAEYFNYKSNQSKIAAFFMSRKELDLRSCLYCGIDFISSFTDFPDYTSNIDFINKADPYELLYVKDMDTTIANAIVLKRTTTTYTKVDDIPATPGIIKSIKKIPFSNSHNHFTLDHMIPQGAYKFFSLCLYNLVPSCYSCNSKFKKARVFELKDELKYISPTSKHYSLNKDFEFRLYFTGQLNTIQSTAGFSVSKFISKNEEYIQKYLRMFKIPGRYTYHKNIALKLIENRVNYSDSRINEIKQQTGMSDSELRTLIFGEELFNDDLLGLPFVKFKRDIAKNIKII